MWNALKYGTWNVSQPRTSAVNALVGGGYAPLAAMILASRGLDTPEKANAYLDCNCTLLDPFLMTDMALAAGRVGLAMTRGEKIAVFGDYDVDGVTATCLLTDFLRKNGADCVPYIPGRLEEGYGLNPIALHALAEQGVNKTVTPMISSRARIFPGESSLSKTTMVDWVASTSIFTSRALPSPMKE